MRNYKLILIALLIALGVTLWVALTRSEEVPSSTDETAPIPDDTEITTTVTETTETTKSTDTPTDTPTEPEPETETVTSWEEIPLEAELQTHIVDLCSLYDIPPSIVFAMCWRESRYSVGEIGDNGNSYGLMQVQPRWHYDRMNELNATDLLNPYQNTAVGVDYLYELLERYDGNMYAALVAYNRGSYDGTITEYAVSVISEAERIETAIMEV